MSDHEVSDHSTDDSTSAEFDTHEDDDDDVEVPLTDEMRSSLSKLASRLCSICREFPRGEIEEQAFRTYHPSLTSLRKSADAGCCICKDLSRSLEVFCKQLQPPAAPSETCSVQCTMGESINLSNPDRIAFGLWFKLKESDCHRSVNNFHDAPTFASMKFFPVDSLSLGPELLYPELEKSTAKSATSMNLARHWYQQCLSHSTCRNWRQHSRQIPTRLVRIGRPNSNYPDMISAELCDTEDFPLDIVYTTLSHLWGDNQIFQLRQSNIEKLRRSIPFRQLPQVFQDAMYVSLELGVNYIWIDSLCIIQDSKEDWTYEAKRMGNVYQYATCNIAASGYKDSSLSLLDERAALSQVHPPVFADCTVKRRTGQAFHFHGLYIRANDLAFHREIADSILNSRAWVSQERALSPGILHFTPEMMWWECNDLVANEAFPTGHILWGDEVFKPCTIRCLAEGSDRKSVYAFWREFVCAYAGKELTYEKDRFPAAVGIARTLGELIDDNLVAGFWEGDLIRSLIMERRGGVEDIPSTPRAPSWSWASLRGGCGVSTTGMPELVQPLNGVSITVLSDLLTFKSDLDSTSLELSDVRGLEITAPLRRLPLGSDSEWSDFMWIVHDIERKDDSSEIQVPANEAWRLCDPTHFLVLAKADTLTFNEAHVWALLVQKSLEAEGRNTFRRLGVVNFFFDTEEKMEEYFGLKEDEGQYILNPFFGECGFQKILLI